MNNEDKTSIDNNSSFLSRVKGNKNIKLIIFLLIISIIMLLADNFINQSRDKEVSKMTENEERLASVIEKIDGINSCEVYINYDKEESFFSNNSSKINGVLVVCKGENTVSNKLVILTALQKALSIKEDIIEILIL